MVNIGECTYRQRISRGFGTFRLLGPAADSKPSGWGSLRVDVRRYEIMIHVDNCLYYPTII